MTVRVSITTADLQKAAQLTNRLAQLNQQIQQFEGGAGNGRDAHAHINATARALFVAIESADELRQLHDLLYSFLVKRRQAILDQLEALGVRLEA